MPSLSVEKLQSFRGQPYIVFLTPVSLVEDVLELEPDLEVLELQPDFPDLPDLELLSDLTG